MSSLLPTLRNDLTLQGKPTLIDGHQYYLLFDPLKNNYLRIDEITMLILSHWQLAMPEKIIDAIYQNHGLHISKSQIEETLKFLTKHELVMASSDNYIESLKQRAKKKVGATFQGFFQQFIFIKISLCRPDKFIQKLLPYFIFMFNANYWRFMAMLFLIMFSIMLNERSYFYGLLDNLDSFKSLMMIAVGMSILKVVHELGHAFATRFFDCEVGSMGVAFILFFPILYTDTKASWKLSNPKHRLLIDCAGMLFEINFVIWCMVWWHLSDSIFLKQGLAYLIGIGLVSTIFINANPLIKFDGYYAFSSFLNTDNLQQKSFELTLGLLKEKLLGLPHKSAHMEGLKKIILITFSIFVWIYRFFLYFGIAVFFYYKSFKALGIALFFTEIILFILKPLCSELKIYGKTIMTAPFNKNFLPFYGICLFGLFFLFYPWSTTLSIPAVLQFATKQDIYAIDTGFIVSVPNQHQIVNKNEIISQLDSPTLQYYQQKGKLELDYIKLKISSEQKNDVSNYLESEFYDYLQVQQQLKTTQQQITALSMKSPLTGVVANRLPILEKQQNINKDDFLFSVIQTNNFKISAFMPEYDLQRITFIENPIFLSDNPNQPPLPLTFVNRSSAAIKNLPSPYLASSFKGPIPIYEAQHNFTEFVVKDSYFPLTFSVSAAVILPFEQRGYVIMTVKKQSLASRLYTKLVALIIKESSF